MDHLHHHLMQAEIRFQRPVPLVREGITLSYDSPWDIFKSQDSNGHMAVFEQSDQEVPV